VSGRCYIFNLTNGLQAKVTLYADNRVTLAFRSHEGGVWGHETPVARLETF